MVTVVPSVNQHNTSFFSKRYEEQPDNGRLPMQREADRLNSYKNWPCKFMEPSSLAKAGFYYVNKDDIVRCAFCSIEIGQWRHGDDAMQDHTKWSERCPFVLGINCGNVPIEVDAVPMTSRGQDTCGKYGIEIRPNSYPERDSGHSSTTNGLNLTKLGVQPSRGPAYSGYATLESRLNSFSEWPRSLKQKPEELAAAGFFYNGKGDQTICFHCGGGLKDWEDDDNPWEQHAKWFSKCNFVRIQKGQEYISEICSKQEAVLTPEQAASIHIPATNNLNITPVNQPKDNVSPLASEPTENKAKELVASENSKVSNTNTLCKICYGKEVGVVFLPCGHIVACIDCAPALTTCAVCRKPLKATVRAFLS
ncbi:hypothetical protein RN001_006393 [Aquatica leii]|uniref:RING-type domain-containing protein n=1 Tax=Aquatica leii TaxID=1421715 RepID=A0AAN7PDM0_9COLE|nr:hypothetical protein RN001_006393 [Aquatica leii]